jgi:hypothetical protein
MDLASILAACTVTFDDRREPCALVAQMRAESMRSQERNSLLRTLLLIAEYEPLERKSAIIRLSL